MANERIRNATLNHCMNTFKDDHPHGDVELLVKMVNAVHDKRMVKADDEDVATTEVTKDDFDELVKKLEKKNKRSYDFLVKTCDNFKHVIFKLCKRLLEAETFPARFLKSTLHQLWKKSSIKKIWETTDFCI